MIYFRKHPTEVSSNLLLIRTILYLMHILWTSKVAFGAVSPQIKPFYFSANVEENQREQVICSVVAGEPPFSFNWMKDGINVNKFLDIKIEIPNDFYSVLILPSVKTENIGNYTCIVSNSAGSDSYTASLIMKDNFDSEVQNSTTDVAMKKFDKLTIIIYTFVFIVNAVVIPKIKPFYFTSSVEEGQREQIICSAISGDPPLTFSWTKDGVDVNKISDIRVESPSNFYSVLVILSVKPKNIGNYTCTVTNSAGSDSFSAALVMKEILVILEEFSIPLRRYCAFMPLYFIEYSLEVVGEMIIVRKLFSVIFISLLEILSVTCIHAPQIKPFYFSTTLQENQREQITCSAIAGDPPLSFSWTKDGINIDKFSDIIIESPKNFYSVLVILSIQTNHIGNYTCIVKNSMGSDSFTAALVLKGLIIPKIKPFYFSSSVEEGHKEQVICSVVAGDAPLTFIWKKDGSDISKFPDIKVDIANNLYSVLAILSVRPENIGNYTCIVKNPVGSDSYTAGLVMKGVKPPKIKPFHFSDDIQENQREQVTCLVKEGELPLNFQWMKDGVEIRCISNVLIKQIDDFSSMLTIPSVTVDNVGNYTCTVTNNYGSDRYTALLKMKGESKLGMFLLAAVVPRIKPFHFTKDIHIGQREQVVCLVIDGNPPFTFIWTKDGSNIDNYPEILIDYNNYNSILMIASVQPNNIGNYTCTVSNNDGSDSYTAALLMKGKTIPKIKPFHFTQNLREGLKEQVTCAVNEGETPLTFTWLKDGEDIMKFKKIKIVDIADSSLLIIPSVQSESIGNYTCIVRNSMGSDSYTSQLILKGLYKFNADFILGVSPPKIKPFHFTKDIQEGEREQVTCGLNSGNPSFVFSWMKDGINIKNFPDISIVDVPVSYTSLLVISSVQAKHVGNYTCIVKNSEGIDSYTAALVMKGKTIPKIKPFHFTQNLREGLKEQVICAVNEGEPPLTFTWLKDGEDIMKFKKIKIVDIADSSLLIIPSVQSESIGNYTCIVRNSVGSDSYTSQLILKGLSLPKIKPFHFTSDVREGQRQQVTCTVTKGDSPFSFEWKKDNVDTKKFSGINIVDVAITDTSLLNIPSVQAEHIGNYTCIVSNSEGTDSYTAVLLMNAVLPPKIRPFQFTDGLKEGQREQVTCAVLEGDFPLSFMWMKDQMEIERFPDIIVEKNDFYSVLIIPSVQGQNVGNYSCIVENAVGRDKFMATLMIKAVSPPKIRPFQFTNGLKEGQREQIICAVLEGDSPFIFTWMKDQMEIEGHSDIKTEKNEFYSVLIFPSVHAQNIGNYSCIIENSFGSDRFTAALVIKGKYPPKIKDFHFTKDVEIGEREQPKSIGNYSCIVINSFGSDIYTAALLMKAMIPPKIKPFHFTTNIRIGQREQAVCTVIEGDSPFTFTWLKDQIDIKTLPDINVDSIKDFSSFLTIPSIQPSNIGNYTCIVQNSAGSDSYTASLVVKGIVPPKIKPFYFTKDIKEGEREQAICAVKSGDSPLSFTWMKDNSDISNFPDIKVEILNKFYSVLIIPSVHSTNIGNYTCIVTNSVGSDSFTATLMMKDFFIAINVPRIKPFHFTKDIQEGEREQIYCAVKSGDAPFTFQWLKDGIDIRRIAEIKVETKDFNSLLMIPIVKTDSIGNYTCTVTNSFGTDSYTAQLLMKGIQPPKISPFHFSNNVVEGQRQQIFCTVIEGDPPLAFTWKKDNMDIQKFTGISIDSANIYSSYLMIHSVQMENMGNYTCMLSLCICLKTFYFLILFYLVAGLDPPKIKQFHFSSDIQQGQREQVTCVVIQGDLPLHFKWQKNGINIKETGEISINKADDFTSLLTLHKVNVDSIGNYTCIVTNAVGSDIYTASLVMKVPPRWVKEPTDIAATLGSRLTIDCSATGYPQPQITWDKLTDRSEHQLPVGSDSQRTLASNGSLTFLRVDESDKGVYICQAYNGIGNGLQKKIHLTVHVAPKVKGDFSVITVRKGFTAHLKCEVFGEPPLTITWKKEDTIIAGEKGSRFETLQENTANGAISDTLINDSQKNDTGIYTCHVSSQFGEAEGKIQLVVLEPPSPPRGIKVNDVTSRTARLSWQSPYGNSDSTVVTYIVRYWRDEGKFIIKYYIRKKMNTPIGAPTDVNVEPIGSRTLKVSWKAPLLDHRNGIIKGYYVGHKESDSSQQYRYQTVEKSGIDPESLLIAGLQKAKVYNVVVKAFNTAGSGPESHPVEAYSLEGDPPPAPSISISHVTSSSVQLNWENSQAVPTSTIKQYLLEFHGDNKDWIKLHIPNNRKSFVLNGLDSSRRYQLRLAAYNRYGRGDFAVIGFTTAHKELVTPLETSSSSTPFYLRSYVIIPVAASIVVIVTTLATAWVCYKRMTLREKTQIMLTQQYGGSIAGARASLHSRNGYSDIQSYSPPPNTRYPPGGVAVPEDDAYDAPWDMSGSRDPRDVRRCFISKCILPSQEKFVKYSQREERLRLVILTILTLGEIRWQDE
ncbi:titin-like [Centruroides sculpturatus]|uniref:titin-like n=1 Tax=Centruroides sculpturatus TaxID=218467 RepID=UPI000C6CBF8C|nr:titin-like [Centruroides sculpturatus]